ncbi:SprB repeat-containing protein, partial [Bacillus sp. SIMBA_005]|uniref:SprB repeat-containing protein n=1 Tax=Bacillus sp. SIMBA_005 TaxID=3085754 RepID=UPI0039794E9F
LKPTVLTLDTRKIDVKCYNGTTGSILITPTSGKAPYTYTVTNGGTAVTTTVSATTTTASVLNLPAGTYDIEIEDGIKCKGTAQ